MRETFLLYCLLYISVLICYFFKLNNFMHLLSPISTVASIFSLALHCHVDHLHSFCSNIYSHSSNKPRHQWEGAQQGGGSEEVMMKCYSPETQLEHTVAGQEKNSKGRNSSLTFQVINPIQADLLPGDTALLASCQHLSIPHSSWTTSDIPADKQCLLSSITLSVDALVSLSLSYTMSSTTHVFYLTLQNKTKLKQTLTVNSNCF